MLRLLVLIASTLLAFLLQNEEWLNCQKHFAFLIMKFMHFNEILGENAVTQCSKEQKTFKSMQETKTYTLGGQLTSMGQANSERLNHSLKRG